MGICIVAANGALGRHGGRGVHVNVSLGEQLDGATAVATLATFTGQALAIVASAATAPKLHREPGVAVGGTASRVFVDGTVAVGADLAVGAAANAAVTTSTTGNLGAAVP